MSLAMRGKRKAAITFTMHAVLQIDFIHPKLQLDMLEKSYMYYADGNCYAILYTGFFSFNVLLFLIQ